MFLTCAAYLMHGLSCQTVLPTDNPNQRYLVASYYALLLVYTRCIVFSSYVFSRLDDGPALGPKLVVCTIKTLPPSSCVLTLPFYSITEVLICRS
jgi:hypothetical protein